MNTEKSLENEKHSSCLGAVIHNCSFCEFFQHEEIGDSDFGGVYAENPSCSKYFDTDEETEEDIPNFDRTIERDCCKLDFWGSFSETYELFKVKFHK